MNGSPTASLSPWYTSAKNGSTAPSALSSILFRTDVHAQRGRDHVPAATRLPRRTTGNRARLNRAHCIHGMNWLWYPARMEIRVKVKAGAKNDRIEKTKDGYAITVRAKAAGGMANDSVLALVSREIGVPEKNLRIIRGLRSPSKTIQY